MAKDLGSGANVVDLPGAKRGRRPKAADPAPAAEAPNPRVKPGDNSKEEEDKKLELLLIGHLNRLRQQRSRTATAKAAFDAEKEAETHLFNLAKADKFTRKELTELLTDGAARRRDLEREEERRAKLRTWAGLPAGSQSDLFATTPLEARDEISWEADGYQAGLRAAEPKPPEECAPRFHQAWMRGYHAGQARNAEGLKAVKAADKKRAPAPTPVEKAAATPQKAAEQPAGDGKPVVDQLPDGTKIEGESFVETSPEELARQIGRRAEHEPEIV